MKWQAENQVTWGINGLGYTVRGTQQEVFLRKALRLSACHICWNITQLLLYKSVIEGIPHPSLCLLF